MKVERFKSIKVKIVISCVIISLSSLTIGIMGYIGNIKGMEDLQDKMLIEKLEGDINSANQYLYSTYGDIRQKDEELYEGSDEKIEGRFEMVDQIESELGDLATIFTKEGDSFKSISSNLAIDGERAIGTLLDDDAVYETISKGDTFVGPAEILGNNYYSAYQPLKDDQGEVYGLLFVGVPTEMSKGIIKGYSRDLGINNIYIIGGSLIIAIIAAIFISNESSNSIVTISDDVEKIARYDLTYKENKDMEKMKNKENELGVMANSVANLQENLVKLVENVLQSSNNLGASSQELSATSEQALDTEKQL